MKEEMLEEIALERKRWAERRERFLRELEKGKLGPLDKEKSIEQMEKTYAALIKQHDAMKQLIEQNII